MFMVHTPPSKYTVQVVRILPSFHMMLEVYLPVIIVEATSDRPKLRSPTWMVDTFTASYLARRSTAYPSAWVLR